jgi:hypothetical protein
MNAMILLHGHNLTPMARWLAGAIATAALLFALQSSPTAQSCNPVIDGTYCATQMPQPSTSLTQSSPIIRPVSDFSNAFSVGSGAPGTFAGIAFQSGGTTCIGLLRRGACN